MRAKADPGLAVAHGSGPVQDSDLAEIVAAWPTLTEDVRQTVLDLIRPTGWQQG
jgi:hypothetical protein